MAIGKMMLAFFGWNCYIAITGLSFLEFKNLYENRSYIMNDKEDG